MGKPGCAPAYDDCMSDVVCQRCFADIGFGFGYNDTNRDSHNETRHWECVLSSQLYRMTIWVCLDPDASDECKNHSTTCLTDPVCDACFVYAASQNQSGQSGPGDPLMDSPDCQDTTAAAKFELMSDACFNNGNDDCPLNSSIAFDNGWISPCDQEICQNENQGVPLPCCGAIDAYCKYVPDPACELPFVQHHILSQECNNVSIVPCLDPAVNAVR